MKQRELKKLVKQGRLGNSYVHFSDGKVFENRDGSIIYRGTVAQKDKKYYIAYIPTKLIYKEKGIAENLLPHQVLCTEMRGPFIAFFRDKLSLEELTRIYS